MTEGLVFSIAKTAIVTVVMSRVSKAIGEKDISEIIEGTGWVVCGVNTIIAFKPLVKGIQEFNASFGNAMQGFKNVIDTLVFWK